LDFLQTRLQKFGYNELKKEKGISPLTLFINQFKNLLIIILLVAVAIAKEMGVSRESDMVMTGDELEKWACVRAPVPFQGCPLISKTLSLLAPRGLFIHLRRRPRALPVSECVTCPATLDEFRLSATADSADGG
jgi:hypothetical protein